MCPSQQVEAVMYCGKCGQENPAERTTCSQCGQPLMMPTQPPAAAGPAAPAGEAQTAGKAIASLVLGLLGLVICLAGIPAIILGHMALSEIKKSAGRLKGDGMALAGLIMGYLSIIALPVILIIAAIAIPNLLRSRIAANESSAVGSIRTVNTAEVTYASTYPKAGFSTSLEALGGPTPCTESSTAACLIDSVLASGQKSGYRFTYEVQDANGDGTNDAYLVQALPVTPGTTGMRSFCSDETGVIRSTTSETCTRESPPLQ
jgi:type II secretory pathway pseudopilin PulG